MGHSLKHKCSLIFPLAQKNRGPDLLYWAGGSATIGTFPYSEHQATYLADFDPSSGQYYYSYSHLQRPYRYHLCGIFKLRRIVPTKPDSSARVQLVMSLQPDIYQGPRSFTTLAPYDLSPAFAAPGWTRGQKEIVIWDHSGVLQLHVVRLLVLGVPRLTQWRRVGEVG